MSGGHGPPSPLDKWLGGPCPPDRRPGRSFRHSVNDCFATQRHQARAMQHRERVAIVGTRGSSPSLPTWIDFGRHVAGGSTPPREGSAGRWLLDVADAYDPLGSALPTGSMPPAAASSKASSSIPAGSTSIRPSSRGSTRCSTSPSTPAARPGGSAKTADLDRSRVGVVFGNIVLPTETSSALAREVLGQTLAEQVGIKQPSETEQGEPLNGYVAGLPAGILAKALGLGGGTYTLDAACGFVALRPEACGRRASGEAEPTRC